MGRPEVFILGLGRVIVKTMVKIMVKIVVKTVSSKLLIGEVLKLNSHLLD